MKNYILLLILLLNVACELMQITRKGYTIDEDIDYRAKVCKVIFFRKLPNEFLDSNSKEIGEFDLFCSLRNAEKYMRKEACGSKANFVNIIIYSAPGYLYGDSRLNCTAKLYSINPMSISFSRLDYENEDTLNYYKNIKLTWDDFKGNYNNLDTNRKGYLKAYLSDYNDVDVWFGGIKYYFHGVIDRNKSWIKSEFKNDYYLNHFQKIFDISEIFSLMYKFDMKDIHPRDNNRITNTYRKHLFNMYKYQDLYEKETNYGQDTLKQMIWNEKIAKVLEDMRERVEIK